MCTFSCSELPFPVHWHFHPHERVNEASASLTVHLCPTCFFLLKEESALIPPNLIANTADQVKQQLTTFYMSSWSLTPNYWAHFILIKMDNALTLWYWLSGKQTCVCVCIHKHSITKENICSLVSLVWFHRVGCHLITTGSMSQCYHFCLLSGHFAATQTNTQAWFCTFRALWCILMSCLWLKLDSHLGIFPLITLSTKPFFSIILR